MCFKISSPADCRKEKSSSAFLDWLKITVIVFPRRLFQSNLYKKCLGLHLNFSTYKKENPSYILKTFRRLVCYSLWDLRGFVPSNYIRFYWSLNYNQGLVELVAASRSTSEGNLKTLSGISKSQVRRHVLL